MKRIVNLNLVLLFYFLISMAAISLSIQRPFHNWDMIMYVAAAKSFEGGSIPELHSFTYNQVRVSVSDSEFEALTNKTFYRRTVFIDPSAFKEQLPFYQIRPVYTFLVYILYKAGMPITLATHLISGIAVAIALMIVYLLARSFLAGLFVWSVPLFSIVFGVFDLARYSTPDGLAFLAYIASVYFYLRQHITALLILLPLIVGIRTDLLLFTVPLYIVLFISFKSQGKWTLISILASIGIYDGVIVYWRNPGWATTFWFTLVRILTHPISEPPVLKVSDYLYVLAKGIIKAGVDNQFVTYTIINGYFLYFLTKDVYARWPLSLVGFMSSQSVSIVGVISTMYIGTHFVLFPVTWSRFFSAPYLIGAFSLLYIITNKWWKSAQQSAAPDRYSAALHSGR